MNICPNNAKRRLVGIIASGLLLTAGSGLQAQEMRNDEDIAGAVETEFLFDDMLPYNRISVVVSNGIVTLNGEVSSLYAREQAESIAGIVRGVRGVVNRLDVNVPARPATELADAVRTALKNNPATDTYEIDVAADKNGVVTLTGTTDSDAERQLAEKTVTTIAGVSDIENRLAVDYSRVYRGLEEIENDVSERLSWDARVDASLIDVLVRQGGRVALSGTVGSLAEKNLAADLAWINGVHEVDAEHLEVEAWARGNDRDLGREPTTGNADIERALITALEYDPRVLAENVNVHVTASDVWLRGTVGSFDARRAAAEDARNITGVGRVLNYLRIEREMLDDSELHELLSNALRAENLYEQIGISLHINDGQVRLVGDVDNAGQYWRASEIIATARGVEDVENDLTIRGESPNFTASSYTLVPRIMMPGQRINTSTVTDRTLHQSVQRELFWSPFVDEEQVSIDVDDGTVTLSGSVDSTRESLAARDNALEGGALVVRNQLQVK